MTEGGGNKTISLQFESQILTGGDDLRETFSKYGEVERCAIKTEVGTNRSRGFGFLVFRDAASVEKVLNLDEEIHLDGRKLDCRRAKTRPGRVFVGGLTEELTEEDLKEHFGQFGTITEFEIPKDKSKDNAPRGFCFITFEKEHAMKKLLEEPKQTIKGVELRVEEKRAPSKGEPGYRSGGGARGSWSWRDNRSGGSYPGGTYGSYGSWGKESR
ncbi:unnamed protein product [Cyprideis torosa]|uniref:Uncharacterized protein n=1 Tax=Cyprideis torosa TaxID=163714 RepID=A0A7R8W8F7_9CRUS|nr:unnamed protein product [Cyprideis torosa]CAG0888519.1 unnamed protein product [Cyprideis torosa]